GAYRRALTSIGQVYASADDADIGDSATPIEVPGASGLGDASAAYRSLDASEANESPMVTYTFKVRRGNVVMTTEESGVAWSLTSPDESLALARLPDSHAASILNG